MSVEVQEVPPSSVTPVVLVVDDTPSSLTTVAEMMAAQGYEVRAASNGPSALRYARLAPLPDVILLDVMMPEMDGFAVLAELQTDAQTRNIPVIFVTALGAPADEEAGLAAGAVDYVSKPIKPAVLAARVRTQIELKRARDRMADENRWLEAEVQRRLAERGQMEARLRIMAKAFSGLAEAVCITDAEANILEVNEAFTRMTGYAPDSVRQRNPRMLQSGLQTPAFYRDMWTALAEHDYWQGEITDRRQDGSLFSAWLSITAVRDEAGKLVNYVGLSSDLSERKAAETRIEFLASYDVLTALPNRNLFNDRLVQSLRQSHRFARQTAILLLDIDRFRTINDSFGATLGDEVLIELAQRFNSHLREGDTVGRRGGNEFGLVMANIAHEHDAIALAQRYLAVVSEPIALGEQRIALTASVGISLSPRDGDSAEALLKAADLALDRAKAAGGNTFRFYASDMDANAARRLGLETALRLAIDNGELAVHYQPQVSLESGHLIGMEALLRWNSPKFGQVSPSEFIPLAEETGIILPIGDWVLRRACLQTRRWLDLGMAQLRVAVNVSTRQFRQADFSKTVASVLAETGLAPEALELEITESAWIDDIDQAVLQSRALKSLGIKLSLDDFGTGYSSLSYLSRFPLDKLKIDQGFVRDITENPVNAAIATAAIVMGRSLNLTVLAEGVETEAQARFLRRHRCDSMQGYLFSRPLPAEDFEQLLAGRKQLPMISELAEEKPTLLLVDDEPNVLNALHRLFRREGYQILMATAPKDAFELLARHPVQVIISDQRMPDMTGTEFFAKVRQLYPDTLRIVLTGYTDLESVTEAINRGAIYKFLTKPWDDDQLRDQIREAFRLAREKGEGA